MTGFFKFYNLETLKEIFPSLDLKNIQSSHVDSILDENDITDTCAARMHQLFWADILWGAYIKGEITKNRFQEDLEKIIPLSVSSELFSVLMRASLRFSPPDKKGRGRRAASSHLKRVAKVIEKLIKKDHPYIDLSEKKVREEVGEEIKKLGGKSLLNSNDLERLLDHRKTK